MYMCRCTWPPLELAIAPGPAAWRLELALSRLPASERDIDNDIDRPRTQLCAPSSMAASSITPLRARHCTPHGRRCDNQPRPRQLSLRHSSEEGDTAHR